MSFPDINIARALSLPDNFRPVTTRFKAEGYTVPLVDGGMNMDSPLIIRMPKKDPKQATSDIACLCEDISPASALASVVAKDAIERTLSGMSMPESADQLAHMFAVALESANRALLTSDRQPPAGADFGASAALAAWIGNKLVFAWTGNMRIDAHFVSGDKATVKPLTFDNSVAMHRLRSAGLSDNSAIDFLLETDRLPVGVFAGDANRLAWYQLATQTDFRKPIEYLGLRNRMYTPVTGTYALEPNVSEYWVTIKTPPLAVLDPLVEFKSGITSTMEIVRLTKEEVVRRRRSGAYVPEGGLTAVRVGRW